MQAQVYRSLVRLFLGKAHVAKEALEWSGSFSPQVQTKRFAYRANDSACRYFDELQTHWAKVEGMIRTLLADIQVFVEHVI